jgi:hypothetical protein
MTTANDQPVWVDDPDAAPTARAGLPVVVIGAGPIGLAAAARRDPVPPAAALCASNRDLLARAGRRGPVASVAGWSARAAASSAAAWSTATCC